MEQIQQFATAGLNIQFPWSELILSGKKVVETRNYALPKKYVGKTLAIIETNRKNGDRSKAASQIVGLIQFSSSFQYRSLKEWKDDFDRHQVMANDETYSYKAGVPKWGWEILRVCRVSPSVAPPKIRGIKFAKRCLIPVDCLRTSKSRKTILLSHCTF